MFKNYFRTAYRSLLKSKTSSLINIFGLSFTIGCGILAYLFVHSEISRDTFHAKADHIYLVEATIDNNGANERWGKSPAPLGPALENNHTQVKQAVRIAEGQALVITDNFHFSEYVRFADPAFFSVFSFPLKYGDAQALQTTNGVVITPEMSAKYFEVDNPVGQSILLSINGQPERAFTVAGVVEKLPVNTSLSFSLLLPYQIWEESNAAANDWTQEVRATFVEVENQANIDALPAQMTEYIETQNAAILDEPAITSFHFKNISDLSLHSKDVKNTIAYRVNWPPIMVLCTITLFLFLLSCFNYMNITLGSVHTRMKEIGVRKVMGSKKSQLVTQFLLENILLCFISLILGFIIATSLLIPGFEYITHGLDLGFVFTERYDLWIFLVGLMISLGFISGAYPAFYISSFKPVTIFSGRFKQGGSNRFMESLLTVQFVLALITMALGIGMTLNNRYMTEVDWGYNNEDTFVINLGPASYDIMHNAAAQLPNVTHIAGARNNVGSFPIHNASINTSGQIFEAVDFKVSPEYFDIMQPVILQGALPERPDQILINEKMAADLGLTDPVAQMISVDSLEYNIAGIVRDFHFFNFSEAISPAFLRLGSETNEYNFLSMRIRPGSEQETIENLAGVWNANFPESGFSHFFQHAVFDGYNEDASRIVNIFYFAAILALILSCAGLFGLVSQQISSRMKEMSIRKILGASVTQIVQLVNRKFLFIILFAGCIGMPVSYLILNALLSNFSVYHMPLGPKTFILATAFVLGTAILTLSPQIFRLTNTNPADLLRDD